MQVKGPENERRQALRLVTLANDDLRLLGVSIAADNFICPLCLRRLPDDQATLGHYPAQRVRAIRRTVLLCSGCNSFTGTAYEADAAAFFGGTWRVALESPRGGRVRTRASVQQEGNQIQIHAQGRKFGREFAAMQARSTDPAAVQITFEQPTDANPKRALLTWSLLDWFFHAGYNYVATRGAALARQLVLRPGVSQRPGILFVRGSLDTPLPRPSPVLLTRSATKPESLLSPQEFVGLGTSWGRAVVVLPWANDTDERPWARTEELMAQDGLRSIYTWPVLEIARRAQEPDLKRELTISDPDTNLDAHVTERLTQGDLRSLVEDRSAYRLEPPRARPRVAKARP